MTVERKIFEPGIYDISNSEYHSSAGISRSGIMEFRKSPKHFWHRYLNQDYKPKDSTPDMSFGSAFHCYLMEPEKFDNEYLVSQDFDKRTTVGKEGYAAMLKKAEGRILIEQCDLEEIKLMAKSILDDDQARQLINDACYEKSIYWIDPDTQLLCKCRPDIMHDHFVVDLKTTKDASFRAFQKDFYSYGYHLQIAMIHEGFKHGLGKDMTNFIDLAVEKIEPYNHCVYPIDESALAHGIKEFKYYLMEIKQCFDDNNWQSYPTQILTLPAYANTGE